MTSATPVNWRSNATYFLHSRRCNSTAHAGPPSTPGDKSLGIPRPCSPRRYSYSASGDHSISKRIQFPSLSSAMASLTELSCPSGPPFPIPGLSYCLRHPEPPCCWLACHSSQVPAGNDLAASYVAGEAIDKFQVFGLLYVPAFISDILQCICG